jgi:hypothetical protein
MKTARLTSDQLDKIKQADVANLIRKVKSGKTLTASERKMLDQQTDPAEKQESGKGEKIPDVAQSMKQAEAFWGISFSTLKIAKSAGCPAFIQHRVYREPLLKWLEENPDSAGKGEAITDAAELKRQKTEAEVKLLRAKIAREERETIPLVDAKEEWARAASIVQEEAKQLMERDHYRVFVERCKTRIGELLEA